MYLKKLEIFGFKSFANKTELVFEPGVSAIVGPNGCGKSNISDSIKWVLGEQSAKELRGSKMEDVIFNGTDDTQPVNLAEVSLVLSNKDHALPVDYDEVIISRRVFRSGESEYFLNKTPVRMRDIIELLAGTGIGVSSYSVTEQGKMDRVISSRPEDRREIFEEASGITKYKNKKKEALLKLEHSENNLVRLADIINEVKRQIASIERQAHKAEKFRIEFDKLKELDLKLAFREFNKVKAQQDGIKQENDGLKQKEGHLSLEFNLQADELRLHREKKDKLDEQISEAKVKSTNIGSTIDKNENAVRINRERVEELTGLSQSLTREIEDIARRGLKIKEKIDSVESDFKLINDEKENKQTRLTEAEKTSDSIIETIKECEKTISESKFAIMENASSQSKLKNELNKISASLTTISSRHRRLNIEKDNTSQELESIEHKLGNAQHIFTEQKEILDKVLRQLSSLRSEHELLSSDLKEKSGKIESLKQKLASSGSKLELLKDLKDKKEGFSEGVKAYVEFIEHNSQAQESFVGIIADILQPQEGLVTALESALGEKSQMIVVRTRKAIKDALDYLKSQKKGRAQFVAVDELVDLKTDSTNFESPLVLGRLSDFVKAQDEHMPILRYILKDTYLVEDLEREPVLRESCAILVTRDGDRAAGIMVSGGGSSREEYTSIIGRDGKIAELSAEVEALNKEISDYEDERSQMILNMEQTRKELDLSENTAKKEEIDLNARESEQLKSQEVKDKLQQEFNVINLELEEIAEEETALKNREAMHKEELEKVEREHQGLESLINQSQATISSKSLAKEKLIVTLTELRTQMSLVNEKHNSQNDALNMLKSSLEAEENGIESRKGQIEEAMNKSSSLGLETERLREENKVLAGQNQIVDGELIALQDERKSAFSVIEEIENKTRDKQKELDDLRSGISTFHINLNELNYKASSLTERIQSAYRVDLEQEDMVFDGDEDWNKMATEVEALKEKIERIGPVNMIAIEEHKELQDRYDFLTSQQEDLLNAKESLHKAINKINRTTRKMFMETFEQIRAAFKDYFKLLFGGGAAELFLVDQADVLESGIEIVVRPPGKKLQNITLLSGGEKALTAIALLFALFKVRPTPFCVLDEIDAPLDEANIDRFSGILQEFVKTTQFIIITHNKKTISVSDIMYGITMEKSGVSKIVSVKFAESHKAPEKEEKIEEAESRKVPEKEQEQGLKKELDKGLQKGSSKEIEGLPLK